jgi:PTS system cellobiose-specific IIA component
MDKSQIQEISFQMVVAAGNAKQLFIESIRALLADNEKVAAAKYEEGLSALHEAHKLEAGFMVQYARGELDIDLDIFFMHANDHLAMALTMQDICREFSPLIKLVKGLT